MDKDRSHMTERILNLTLEIIYLLTGEDCIVVKKKSDVNVTLNSRTQSPITVPPPQSLIQERDNDQKILELTNKIIQLLTGEGTLEGNKNLMENRQAQKPLDLLNARRTHGEIHTPTISRGCIKEEKNKNKRPKLHTTCEEDMTISVRVVTKDGDLINNDTEHTQHTSAHVKEEFLLREDGNLTHTDLHIPKAHAETQMTSVLVKGESMLREGGKLTDHTETQITSAHVKEEFLLCEDGNLTHTDIHFPKAHAETQMTSVLLKGESEPHEEGNLTDTDVYTAADLGDIHIKEEPFLYLGAPTDSVNFAPPVKTQGQHLSTPPTGPRTDLIFSCSECEESFDNNIDLLKHQKTHKGKILICSECGKCFSYKSQLIFHKRTHTGEKPFTCSICGKSFTTSSVLIRHQITHTGEKLFSCPECEKCFGSKSDLAIHQRIHTGLKPYSCYYCGACFNTGSSLARHRRIHTGEKPFPCSQCEKSFISSSDLVKHMRVHTGERPFPCPECGKCFACKSSLAKHQRTHTRQKTYTSSDGGESFNALSELIEHKKTSHR